MTARRDPLVTLLQVVALVAPPLAVVVPLAMAPLGILLSVAVLALRRSQWRSWRPPVFFVTVAALLAAWGLVGAAWALDPGQTVKTSLRLLATALVGLATLAALCRFEAADAQRLTAPLLTGILIAIAVVLGDALTGHTLSYALERLGNPEAIRPFKSRFTRGATVVGMLVWPLALLLWRRHGRWPAIAIVAAVAACLLVADSGSAKLAQLSGCVAAVAALAAPRAAFAFARVAVLALVVALPVVVVQFPDPQVSFREWLWLPHSWHHRITIWTFTARRIAEKPVLGWAVDGSRTIPGADDEIVVERFDANGVRTGRLIEAQLPLHPHNAVLQWWLELGAVGTLGMLALSWWLLGRIQAAADPPTRAALLAMFTSAFAISLVSYGFWQSWWQASMWMAAAYAGVLVASARRAG